MVRDKSVNIFRVFSGYNNYQGSIVMNTLLTENKMFQLLAFHLSVYYFPWLQNDESVFQAIRSFLISISKRHLFHELAVLFVN